MDHTTRNETIRALAAASAAEIRSRPARALAAVSGEFTIEDAQHPGGIEQHPSDLAVLIWRAKTHCTERELALERTPNYYTGEHRSLARLTADEARAWLRKIGGAS